MSSDPEIERRLDEAGWATARAQLRAQIRRNPGAFMAWADREAARQFAEREQERRAQPEDDDDLPF